MEFGSDSAISMVEDFTIQQFLPFFYKSLELDRDYEFFSLEPLLFSQFYKFYLMVIKSLLVNMTYIYQVLIFLWDIIDLINHFPNLLT